MLGTNDDELLTWEYSTESQRLITSASTLLFETKPRGKTEVPKSGTPGDMASGFLYKFTQAGADMWQPFRFTFKIIKKKKKHKIWTKNKVFNTYLKYSGDLTVGNDMEMERS